MSGTPAAVTDAAAVIDAARERGWSLATAESLTAGAVVARLVDVPGASDVVAGGAACYSYAAKSRVLGVDAGPMLKEEERALRTGRSLPEPGLLRLVTGGLVVVTLLVVALVLVVLGIIAGRWQWSVAHDVARADAVREVQEQPVRPLAEVMAPHESFPDEGSGQRVTATGRYAGEPLVVVEVQCGDYLGEDDIERFDDRYGR